MSRGILYMRWQGEFADSIDQVLHRSIESIKFWHPELPYHVAEMPADSNLLVKSQMFKLSPFDETLFLDADTTVMGKLDFGFLKAQQHGIACCINANPWQRRYINLPREHDDAIEYSSGVIFWDRRWVGYGTSVRDVFDRWQKLTDDPTTDSRSRYMGTKGEREQPYNDQALFTLAMEQLQFNPCVLPLNWNLYPRWQKHFWAEVKVWHGYFDIPRQIVEWNNEQRDPNAVVQCAGIDTGGQ